MLIQPVDYFLVAWFTLAAVSTAYVGWDQYRKQPGTCGHEVRDDLVQSTRDLQALMSSSPTGDVFARMAAEVARRTPLGRLYGARVIGPSRTLFEETLRRGVARG